MRVSSAITLGSPYFAEYINEQKLRLGRVRNDWLRVSRPSELSTVFCKGTKLLGQIVIYDIIIQAKGADPII